MAQLGWGWCNYHAQYEPSDRFNVSASANGLRPFCRGGAAWEWIFRQYGMTEGQWHDMLTRQSGRCALCDEPMKDPVVDHSHVSGEVRHLLHADCNWWAGFYETHPDRFWRVAKKLRRLKKYNIPVEDDTTVPFAELDSAA